MLGIISREAHPGTPELTETHSARASEVVARDVRFDSANWASAPGGKAASTGVSAVKGDMPQPLTNGLERVAGHDAECSQLAAADGQQTVLHPKWRVRVIPSTGLAFPVLTTGRKPENVDMTSSKVSSCSGKTVCKPFQQIFRLHRTDGRVSLQI